MFDTSVVTAADWRTRFERAGRRELDGGVSCEELRMSPAFAAMPFRAAPRP